MHSLLWIALICSKNRNGAARLCAIRGDSRSLISSKNRSASELTRILNKCEFTLFANLI